MVYRVYVEKRAPYDEEAQRALEEFNALPGVSGLTGLRLLNRYDVEGVDAALFEKCLPVVFSEPQVDDVFYELPESDAVFAVEYLPGQFDQRADSCAECIQLISGAERPSVLSAKVYLLYGEVDEAALAAVKHSVINPVESREAALAARATLAADYPEPPDVKRVEGFTKLDRAGLEALIAEMGLAMDADDAEFCRAYFERAGRDPSVTELRVLDTYWSDHCRHTTFGTIIDEAQLEDIEVRESYENYLRIRRELGRESKPVTLMDLATIGAKYLKHTGALRALDESEEINACSVHITVDNGGVEEPWLLMFKNETHNHPTEIEPFGGAATCIGGAIRDPLSGRAYVYQAMRITGAGDPTVPVEDTLPNKLPQRKLCTGAAAGYSSYGNQIGLATGLVDEIYHPGYVAKRMEIGAVVAAAPEKNVVRARPEPGDVVILLGGRTGRDGMGGATGSSKAHDSHSLTDCGAEVQKGNAPVERKIQRLFRRGDACKLIKRCNDFGAGGVSVAIGELADGLFIDLNKVPKKYDGLDGTELAISESQERMAVALAAEDVDEFIGYAHEENLEATPIATVTEEARVRMEWNGAVIVDVSRDFLNSNGAAKHQDVRVLPGGTYERTWAGDTLAERMNALVTDLNVCSNKGLSERFDSTIGAGTVLMPFGGSRQLTPAMAMVAKLPVFGETTTVSGMAWGFNPYLTEANQFTGSYIAVVESVARLVAAGFFHKDMYLTFQEYFEKLRDEPERWGKPAAAVLGALMAQVDLGIGSIGGKDSMSGSFEQLDVPPTLVSFATAIGSVDRATSPEFKQAGSRVVRIAPASYDGVTPDAAGLVEAFELVERLIGDGAALAVSTPGYGATAEALFKMSVGNGIGVKLTDSVTADELFAPSYGSFLVELAPCVELPHASDVVRVDEVGETTEAYEFAACGEVIDLVGLQEAWEGHLESVFPYRAEGDAVETVSFTSAAPLVYNGTIARPRVIIPVFPGNNCEYDSARAFEQAGAVAETLIINNLTPDKVAESTEALVKAIENSQIIMIPGGFSGGDEPDGSAKFITAFFRAPAVTEAVRDLLQNRDGLMLGICNGFQALVKLGLVPFGDIRPMDEECPTLTFNTIGRHQSRLVRTRVASNLSPWLSRCEVGDIHTVPVSHGEGRFVASPELAAQLAANGQIATQYVDEQGVPSMSLDVNPNGSVLAIEGITSPDGRILGKMGHSERRGYGLYQNVPGDRYQQLFEGGVGYFTD